MKTKTCVAIGLVVAGLYFPTSASATTYSYVGGGTSNWTTPSNWNPNTGVPSSLADQALLSPGSSFRTVVLDQSETIGMLGVGYNTTGNINLTGSTTTLTVGSAGQGGLVGVGASGTTANSSGTLNMGANETISLIGGTFDIGAGNDTTGQGTLAGTVSLAVGATLDIGTSANRSALLIGRKAGTTNSAKTSTGILSATTGGVLSAWLTQLAVGTNDDNASGITSSTGTGTLDLTNFTSATINANTVAVGTSSQGGSAQGTLTLGSGTLTVNQSLNIGSDASFTSSATESVSTVAGAVSMATNSLVTLGVSGSRVAVSIGVGGDSRGTTITRSGTFTASGGTFSGFMSSVTIGSQTATTAGKTYSATGVMDLRSATVSNFDVSGDLIIGYSSTGGQGSNGQLRLPATNAAVGGNIFVGGASASGGNGLLDLGSAKMTLGGNLTIGQTGHVTVVLDGASAGLSLANTSLLSIANAGSNGTDSNAGYFITFDGSFSGTGIYYGLEWQGNHLTELNSLVSDFDITWVNNTSSTIGAFYDPTSDATYLGIGTVPEPSAVALGVVGLVGMVWRARRKQRSLSFPRER